MCMQDRNHLEHYMYCTPGSSVGRALNDYGRCDRMVSNFRRRTNVTGSIPARGLGPKSRQELIFPYTNIVADSPIIANRSLIRCKYIRSRPGVCRCVASGGCLALLGSKAFGPKERRERRVDDGDVMTSMPPFRKVQLEPLAISVRPTNTLPLTILRTS